MDKMKKENMGDQFESESSSLGDLESRTKVFFEKYESSFDSDAKKAVFLEGVLTQKLLNVQYSERKSTPFRSKLKGLNLDERQVKKLLPEIINKLEEYGKNYYRSLESIISKYFVSSGEKWKMSRDEISFYFVLGMNLSHIFNEKKENDGGEENE